MSGINLLPWREMRRRERNRRLLLISASAWVVSAALVGAAYLTMQNLIDNQESRNGYLRGEIAKVEKQIREIEDIRRRREALVARMEVIQNLQSNRTEVVHVFDDLVLKLPKGVYFTSWKKEGDRMVLQGVAQSNARVSSLMNSLDSSDWFANPNLDVINVAPRDGARVSQFTLRLNQQRRKDPSAEDSGDAPGGEG